MIYNIKKLKLKEEKHQQLLSDARLLKQSKNIRFNILSVSKAAVNIEVTQGYHVSENYASEATLTKYTKDLFKDYVDGREVLTQTLTYEALPVMDIQFKYGIPDNYRTKRSNDDDDTDIDDDDNDWI